MALWCSFPRDVLDWNLLMGMRTLRTGQEGQAGAWNSSSCRDEAPVRCGHSSSEVESWPGSRLSLGRGRRLLF